MNNKHPLTARTLLLPTALVAISLGMTATPTWAAPGNITTVAGASKTPTAEDALTGNYGGFSGDGGAAKKAGLRVPADVAVDRAGHLVIADPLNNRVRRVDAKTGVISTIAGFTTAKERQAMKTDESIAPGGSGGFSGDGGAATAALFSRPEAIAFDKAGNLYISDSFNSRVRRVDAKTGKVSTVAGTGAQGYSGDGGPAIKANLNDPRGLAFDSAGNLTIADRQNNRIRKVDARTGKISTFAGVTLDQSKGLGDGGAAKNAQFNYPQDIAFDARGNLYICDTNNCLIRKVSAKTGVISTVAGNGDDGYSGDGGAAIKANLKFPTGIAIDGAGNLFIADTQNNRIRKVDAAGKISTVAGTGASEDQMGGGSQFGGDGGPAKKAKIDSPNGLIFDGKGNLYFADSYNNRIRVIESIGAVMKAKK